MINLMSKLQKLEDEGNPIKASIVGAGQMGCGMAAQMTKMKGMSTSTITKQKSSCAKTRA